MDQTPQRVETSIEVRAQMVTVLTRAQTGMLHCLDEVTTRARAEIPNMSHRDLIQFQDNLARQIQGMG